MGMMNGMIFDVGPARVSGPVRASRVRVILTDTHVIVATTLTHAQAITVTGEPEKTRLGWVVPTEGGKLTVARMGECGCNWPLGRAPASALFDLAGVDA